MRGAQDEAQRRTACRELRRAVDTLLQHPDNDQLLGVALRGCQSALRTAAAVTTATVPLDGFAALRRAGISELAVAPAVPLAELDRLVRHFARIAAADEAGAERAVLDLLADRSLAHLRPRAGQMPTTAAQETAPDWNLLPTLPQVPASLTARIARDLASNLPALAVRCVLADPEALADPAAAAALPRLFERMLQGGDFAGANWLLAETEALPAGPALRDRLLAHAAALADDAWLTSQLANQGRETLLDLTGLVMQLPPAVAERFANTLATTTTPFAAWLRELLRP